VKVKSWYNLGLQLNIEDYDLQTIERNNPQDQEGCKRAMFRIWLNNSPQASYKQLLQALVELDDVREADHLHKKYGELCNKIIVSPIYQPGFKLCSYGGLCFFSHNFQGSICHSQDYNSSLPRNTLFL